MPTIDTAADVAPALARLDRHRVARPAPKRDIDVRSRNRRVLLQALAAGCEYRGHDGEGCHWVSSRSSEGCHWVTSRHNPVDDRLPLYRCDCHFGRSQGWTGKGSSALPCGHILIVRLYALSQDARDESFELDIELAEAVRDYDRTLIFPWMSKR